MRSTEGALRTISGAVSAAVTAAVTAVNGKFRALVGLTTGGLAATDRQFSALYKEAKTIIEQDVRWLDPHEADEVVSNVVNAELKRERGDENSWFVLSPKARRSYLLKAVSFFVIDRDKKNGRRRPFFDQSGDHLRPESGEYLRAESDPLEADAFDDAVADALHHLGKGRDLYVDVRFNSLRHEAAAAKYGVSKSQVKSRMTSGNKLMAEVCEAHKEGRKPVYPKAGRPRKASRAKPEQAPQQQLQERQQPQRLATAGGDV